MYIYTITANLGFSSSLTYEEETALLDALTDAAEKIPKGYDGAAASVSEREEQKTEEQ